MHRPHYNLNLEAIAVNGQTLAIDSSVFTTSTTQGTIVDSGTTLAYLADQAYDPFVNAVSFPHFWTFIEILVLVLPFHSLHLKLPPLQIVSSVPKSANPFVSKGNQCFVTSDRFFNFHE